MNYKKVKDKLCLRASVPSLLLFFGIFLSKPALADCTSTMNHGLFCDKDTAPLMLLHITQNISPFMYSLCLLMIILGGIIMFTTVGNPERYKTGKKYIASGFIGALLFTGFWLILSAIGISFTQ